MSEQVIGSVAPFDLSKTGKFDRKTDQEYLRKRFYELATEYFEVAMFSMAANPRWIPVILSNAAF